MSNIDGCVTILYINPNNMAFEINSIILYDDLVLGLYSTCLQYLLKSYNSNLVYFENGVYAVIDRFEYNCYTFFRFSTPEDKKSIKTHTRFIILCRYEENITNAELLNNFNKFLNE